jgi:hypothetical protein
MLYVNFIFHFLQPLLWAAAGLSAVCVFGGGDSRRSPLKYVHRNLKIPRNSEIYGKERFEREDLNVKN